MITWFVHWPLIGLDTVYWSRDLDYGFWLADGNLVNWILASDWLRFWLIGHWLAETRILASDWLMVITRLGFWPLIGWRWSSELDTGLLLAKMLAFDWLIGLWLAETWILASDWLKVITWPDVNIISAGVRSDRRTQPRQPGLTLQSNKMENVTTSTFSSSLFTSQ